MPSEKPDGDRPPTTDIRIPPPLVPRSRAEIPWIASIASVVALAGLAWLLLYQYGPGTGPAHTYVQAAERLAQYGYFPISGTFEETKFNRRACRSMRFVLDINTPDRNGILVHIEPGGPTIVGAETDPEQSVVAENLDLAAAQSALSAMAALKCILGKRAKVGIHERGWKLLKDDVVARIRYIDHRGCRVHYQEVKGPTPHIRRVVYRMR